MKETLTDDHLIDLTSNLDKWEMLQCHTLENTELRDRLIESIKMQRCRCAKNTNARVLETEKWIRSKL